MIEPSKIFDILKNSRKDEDARDALALLFNQEDDLSVLETAGFKSGPNQTNQNSNVFGGYAAAQTHDSDQNGSSLFAFALSQKAPLAASFILERVGVNILLKKSDKGENGFHAVAKSASEKFRDWFFSSSIFANMMKLGGSPSFKEAVNALTSQGDSVISLDYTSDFTVEDLQTWLSVGFEPTVKIKSGSLLHFFIEKQRADLIAPLCRHSPHLLHEKDEKGRLPIHVACSKDNLPIIEGLIRSGSPLCAEDRNFNRPLHFAVAKGNIEACALILRHQQTVWEGGRFVPYVNLRNASNETCLHLVVTHAKEYKDEGSFSRILDLLFQYGADYTLVTEKDITPLKLAKELSGSKITPSHFLILQNKIDQTYNPQLFTRDMLYSRLNQYHSADTVNNLIQCLDPVMAKSEGDAFKFLKDNFIAQIKARVAQDHPGDMNLIQTFNLLLDQALTPQPAPAPTAAPSQTLLIQYQAPQPQTPQYTQAHLPSRDSSMNLNSNW